MKQTATNGVLILECLCSALQFHTSVAWLRAINGTWHKRFMKDKHAEDTRSETVLDHCLFFPYSFAFVLLLFLQPWPASYVKVSELLLRRRCCWCYWVKMASFFTPGHYAAGQRRNSATPAAAAVAALCSPSIISVLGRLDRVTIAGKGGSQGCGCYLSSGGKFCECILCCTSRFVQDISKPLWD